MTARHGETSGRVLLNEEGWNAACAAAAQEIAARAYDMTLDQMLARNRCRAWIAEGRQVAMYLTHVIGQVPLSETGPHFGRDRTTVAHACARIEDKRDEDYFDNGLMRLEALMMKRVGELKMQRLLTLEAARAAGNRDHEITIEKPLIIRTAKGRFYTFQPVGEQPMEAQPLETRQPADEG
ncbi:helix-turn-helix domain-containing protein [Aquisalinus flavus]|uniref:helix-turn-helix domain-containing protein n=1 Tax=Aquisalinus flavus TaxID=1526572 RepID=UPI0019D6B046|nr:helix-turn-helix domain-containing protein [Aquisalinus flavus]